MSDNPQPVRQVLYGPVFLMVRELLLLVVILGASVGIALAIQVFVSDVLSAGAVVLALLGIEARSAYLRSVFDVYIVDKTTLTRIRFGFAKRLELARFNLYTDHDADNSQYVDLNGFYHGKKTSMRVYKTFGRFDELLALLESMKPQPGKNADREGGEQK